MFLLYLWSCLSRKVFPIFILQKMIKINMPDCFFRKEFKPFCKVLSVTKVYRLPIDSLLICKHLRAKNPAILKVGIPLYKIPFLFYFHLNSILFQCFVHPIFSFLSLSNLALRALDARNLRILCMVFMTVRLCLLLKN